MRSIRSARALVGVRSSRFRSRLGAALLTATVVTASAQTTSVRIRLDGVGDTTIPGVGSTVSAASGSASFGGVSI